MNTTNIRVYAIIINEQKQILVSDEMRFGLAFTKFPGGGLIWGEGTKDCLKRELYEELGLTAEVGDLFYVNDFAQMSAFKERDQLFSFYYFVNLDDYRQIVIEEHTIPLTEEGENVRWVPITELNDETMTFPIDKKVIQRLTAILN